MHKRLGILCIALAAFLAVPAITNLVSSPSPPGSAAYANANAKATPTPPLALLNSANAPAVNELIYLNAAKVTTDASPPGPAANPATSMDAFDPAGSLAKAAAEVNLANRYRTIAWTTSPNIPFDYGPANKANTSHILGAKKPPAWMLKAST